MISNQTQAPLTTLEIEQAMEAFASISEELVSGYQSLSERARHVDAELSRTNAELACKVGELDAVKRHLEAILDSLPTGVVVRDAGGKVVMVNEAAVGILGRPEETVLGERGVPGLLGPRAAGEAREFVRPDGARLVVSSRFSRVIGKSGESDGSVEILDDQTELTRLNERVHQLDKMAALGTMAGGIAHEIRNPMNAIKGFAALLQRGMQPETKEARWARLICDGVDEADTIISSMLTFAAPEQLRLETIGVLELVTDAVDTVRRDLERSGEKEAAWRFEVDCQDVRFEGDHIKLRQAIRNLVANGVQAQPGGGRVRIAARREDDQLVLQVTDGGTGISGDVARRAVEPFFTTHAVGTGLGLALVHRIAQLHGGRFEISSEPTELGGANVFLIIPTSTAKRTR